MAKTPYKSLQSEDILSGHISGLQTDINKIQDVLDMKTSKRSGHKLNPVIDQEDPSLRYRIYEGTERNWLEEPQPIIYRNGEVVDVSEYTLYAPYGVVVFKEQQKSNDNITADFDYIEGQSSKIETIENDVSKNADNINQLNNEIGTINDNVGDLDKRVKDLENSGGGGELPSNYSILGGVEPFYMLSDSYMSHQKRNYDPVTDEGYNTLSHKPSFNVLVYGDTLDAFPFPVTSEMTFKKAGIMLGNSSGSSVRVKIGLYKDTGRLYPGELVFQSPVITVEPDSWGYADIDVTIPAGLYWIARHDGDTAYWNGLSDQSVIHLQKFNGETFLRDLAERPNPFETFGGYRATNISFGEMPSVFPSGIAPFKRAHYCSPWLITG
jgi:hypothetical protein